MAFTRSPWASWGEQKHPEPDRACAYDGCGELIPGHELQPEVLLAYVPAGGVCACECRDREGAAGADSLDFRSSGLSSPDAHRAPADSSTSGGVGFCPWISRAGVSVVTSAAHDWQHRPAPCWCVAANAGCRTRLRPAPAPACSLRRAMLSMSVKPVTDPLRVNTGGQCRKRRATIARHSQPPTSPCGTWGCGRSCRRCGHPSSGPDCAAPPVASRNTAYRSSTGDVPTRRSRSVLGSRRRVMGRPLPILDPHLVAPAASSQSGLEWRVESADRWFWQTKHSACIGAHCCIDDAASGIVHQFLLRHNIRSVGFVGRPARNRGRCRVTASAVHNRCGA